jgi:hypothetical protein
MKRLILIMAVTAISLIATTAWAIPWMYSPTNQHGSLGNNYDEFQNYGGTPYFHDGIDVMQPTGGVHVYSSSPGYLTHTTTGTMYGGLMIGYSYTAGDSGWLYWHIPNSTWQFALGQRINEGDYIGDNATWSVSSFHHVHFDKVVGTSGLPWGWYLPTGNPLDFLTPSAEPTAPEIHLAQGTNLLAFCVNNTSTYQNPSNLSGDLDIIAKLGDHIFNTTWEVIPRRITYTIRGGLVNEQRLAFQFGDPMPAASYSGFNSIVYKDDATCNTEGNYNLRNFFFVLTNNDGDSIIETTDNVGKWATGGYPSGVYTVGVQAADAGGNISQDSMTVTVSSPTHNLSLTLTPTSPLTLPETGGSFTYSVNIHNNETVTVVCAGWINMTYPNGQTVQVLLRNLNLPGGATLTRDMTQVIAGSEPNGTYSYDGYVGLAPYNSWAASGFSFTKGADRMAGPWVGKTNLEGWDAEPETPAEATQTFSGNGNLCIVSPNPFNPTTAISYQLSALSHVSLKVYDITGRLVVVLVDGWRDAGMHQAGFDGSRMASGIYLYRLEAGGQTATGKMVLMK